MPRRHILSDIERNDLLVIPESQVDLIRLYTLSERDLSLISQYSRGIENRLGFAISTLLYALSWYYIRCCQ